MGTMLPKYLTKHPIPDKNSPGERKVSRALQVDRMMKNSASDSSQSPSAQFGAELAGQYGDSVVSKNDSLPADHPLQKLRAKK